MKEKPKQGNLDIFSHRSKMGKAKWLNIFGEVLKHTPLRSGMNDDEAMNALVGAANQHLPAMLRFHLVDKERRTFVAEGFCFLGAIDDWIFLGGPDDLKKLVGRYIKLLGTGEFFDSPYF